MCGREKIFVCYETNKINAQFYPRAFFIMKRDKEDENGF